MIQKHPLLKSTAILTCAGMVSRIIGFFYRIFLSKTIGAEGIGIYLLLFPIQTLLFSLTSSGIQTAISRFVSARLASNDKKGARDILLCGMMLSVLFSGIASFFLYQNANFIAVSLLHEARCSSLLKILSFTLPFAGVHACIIGYYTGLKKAAVPAISQLVEQTARVASSFLFWQIMVEKGIQVTPVLAMYGMLTSEIIVVLYTGTRFLLHHPSSFEKAYPFSAHSIREILTFSLPLSTNRVCLSILQSAESICIPLRLQAFGLARSAALSSYGTLTGMALPLVLFPSAVTNALSVMLLPAVSESQAGKDRKAIARLSVRTVQSCLLLGILCTIFFLVFGNLCGILLFDSNEAGTYIQILSWLCPFLYLGTTLASILNGLGKTFLVFLSNMAALFIRFLFVWFAIPFSGIKGYLLGLLFSQLLHSLLLLFCLNRSLS